MKGTATERPSERPWEGSFSLVYKHATCRCRADAEYLQRCSRGGRLSTQAYNEAWVALFQVAVDASKKTSTKTAVFPSKQKLPAPAAFDNEWLILFLTRIRWRIRIKHKKDQFWSKAPKRVYTNADPPTHCLFRNHACSQTTLLTACRMGLPPSPPPHQCISRTLCCWPFDGDVPETLPARLNKSRVKRLSFANSPKRTYIRKPYTRRLGI